MSKIATREYYAHKSEYDRDYYAYPVNGHPELTSLRRRTSHAGNQKGARQVNRLSEISRGVKAVMENYYAREAFRSEWENHRRRRKVSHRDPDIYTHERSIYKVRTLREYVRARFYAVNAGNRGALKIPAPIISE